MNVDLNDLGVIQNRIVFVLDREHELKGNIPSFSLPPNPSYKIHPLFHIP